MNPGGCDGLVIKTAEVVVLRKRLNSAAHVVESGFKRLAREVQPGESKMIGVAKLASPEAAGMERLQECVIA